MIESNPVQNLKPFFYEEKKTQSGGKIIVTNNLTEINERIPETELLTNTMEKGGILMQQVESVKLTVSE